MESIIFSAKNKLDKLDRDLDPYIIRQLEKAYLELREAYLRIMDI